MKIVYYKSAVCPRCIPTNRFLKRLKMEHPGVEIEEVEVLTHIGRARKAGIMSIPVIEMGGRRYHGVPPREDVLRFLSGAIESDG